MTHFITKLQTNKNSKNWKIISKILPLLGSMNFLGVYKDK